METNKTIYSVELIGRDDAWTELESTELSAAESRYWQLVEAELSRDSGTAYGVRITNQGGEILHQLTADEIKTALVQWYRLMDKFADCETTDEALEYANSLQDGFYVYPAILENIHNDGKELTEQQVDELSDRVRELCDSEWHARTGEWLYQQ